MDNLVLFSMGVALHTTSAGFCQQTLRLLPIANLLTNHTPLRRLRQQLIHINRHPRPRTDHPMHTLHPREPLLPKQLVQFFPGFVCEVVRARPAVDGNAEVEEPERGRGECDEDVVEPCDVFEVHTGYGQGGQGGVGFEVHVRYHDMN